MGDVRRHAVVPVCASVYAACLLPLLLVFGGAGLRTRRPGSPYPFFALIGDPARVIVRVKVKKSWAEALLSLLIAALCLSGVAFEKRFFFRWNAAKTPAQFRVRDAVSGICEFERTCPRFYIIRCEFC